jgi:hypothetical protein
MGDILVGTDDGIHLVGDEGKSWLTGKAVTALARGQGTLWALADGRELWREPLDGGGVVATSEDLRLNCLEVGDGEVVAGTSEAHLVRVDGGELRLVEEFERVEGRNGWYTPWGGPPDVRSFARGADGTLWVNVHVGGILRAEAGGGFTPTIDPDADVHQVAADPGEPRRVLAATAYGLASSDDAGATWSFATEGMHASYCRAVALAGETLLVSCSSGPRGSQAALYRRPLAAPEAPFERCRDGLPEWFERNIDTACLDATGPTAAFGTSAGEVYVSTDAGATWTREAAPLPPVRCLLLAG